MTLEQLKELLESGAITQEQYDAMAQIIEPTAPTPDPEPTPDPDPEPAPTFSQSQLDKALAKERKEKAELKKRLERLEKKALTDEEVRQGEIERQQQEIDEQRREITIEKNKMYAVKALQKANISNTEETMSVIERMVTSCEDEDDIDELITLLKKWHDNAVKAEVDKRFKEGGYTPQKGTNLNGGVNPWAEGQKNLTEQMKIEMTNPELAKQLQAAAGVK